MQLKEIISLDHLEVRVDVFDVEDMGGKYLCLVVNPEGLGLSEKEDTFYYLSEDNIRGFRELMRSYGYINLTQRRA